MSYVGIVLVVAIVTLVVISTVAQFIEISRERAESKLSPQEEASYELKKGGGPMIGPQEFQRIMESAGISAHDVLGGSVIPLITNEDKVAVAIPSAATYIRTTVLEEAGFEVVTYSGRGLSAPEVEAKAYAITETLLGQVPFRIINRFLVFTAATIEQIDWIIRLLAGQGLQDLMVFAVTEGCETAMAGKVETLVEILNERVEEEKAGERAGLDNTLTDGALKELKALLAKDMDVLDFLKEV